MCRDDVRETVGYIYPAPIMMTRDPNELQKKVPSDLMYGALPAGVTTATILTGYDKKYPECNNQLDDLLACLLSTEEYEISVVSDCDASSKAFATDHLAQRVQANINNWGGEIDVDVNVSDDDYKEEIRVAFNTKIKQDMDRCPGSAMQYNTCLQKKAYTVVLGDIFEEAAAQISKQ